MDRGAGEGHQLVVPLHDLDPLGLVPMLLVILVTGFQLFDGLMSRGRDGWLTVVLRRMARRQSGAAVQAARDQAAQWVR